MASSRCAAALAFVAALQAPPAPAPLDPAGAGVAALELPAVDLLLHVTGRLALDGRNGVERNR